MNHGTKTIALPELTANLLRDGGCLIDNLFADLWKQMGMKARLDRIGFHKRSGTSANELVYCLMIWVWLKVDSVGMLVISYPLNWLSANDWDQPPATADSKTEPSPPAPHALAQQAIPPSRRCTCQYLSVLEKS